MNNTLIISLLIAFTTILIASLIFIFNKKNKPEENTTEVSELNNNHKEVEVLTTDESIEKHQEIETLLPIEEAKIEDEQKIDSKLSISISTKTEKSLIKKLDEFETKKEFIKKDVTLSSLAKKFETNTKYLSEIIKTYKNKNFNQYLNELRINQLIEELNTNDKILNTKVSYLASDFGFSSHSTFSTIFTQYIGQTPSEYIKKIKKEKTNQ